ncbi:MULTISPECIES: hypothetical protein [unclassified Sulfitobacter]|uniref:hypothetical protein n=1 Tax=unclassified Sulfitobacter TaxID=196795 RepID=UPI0015931444|nr:hypothetical protein [Sulfitobacter sp. HGT1]
MALISDILLASGAMAAAIYCYILGQRLKHFNSLERGVGGAVAVLSSRVDDLTKALSSAQATAAGSAETLLELTEKAEQSSRRMELRMASLHDIPLTEEEDQTENAKTTAAPQEKPPSKPMFMRYSKSKEVT